jgi:hypothetical protein
MWWKALISTLKPPTIYNDDFLQRPRGQTILRSTLHKIVEENQYIDNKNEDVAIFISVHDI